MDEGVADVCAITGATPQVAAHFLRLTDGDPSQAIQLFFDSPDLASAAAEDEQPPVSDSTRPSARNATAAHEDEHGVVHLDSDDDDVEAVGTAQPDNAYEDDEAMARRLQEEMYAGGDSGRNAGAADVDEDGVRAPLQRRTETLVGDDWEEEDTQSSMLQQMRQRAQARSRGMPSVFNQYASPSSIWDSTGASPHTRQENLAEATGGASSTSSKAARLAELFRPPFEIMSRLSLDDARDEGKEEQKWILVNVQDPSIFDCQALNRDIWKHDGIKETVRENFIFLQYSKDDPAGQQYINYYFPDRDDQGAYPHISIVDPRTGEQLKVWSGPPVPKAADFLMQLYEFLDRYSLDPNVRNPVAKRKVEKPADVGRLTEEQMLDLALQNSLANGTATAGAPKSEDPDDLTKSVGDVSQGEGKGKEAEAQDEEMSDVAEAPPSVFDSIASDRPHSEPAHDPATTTRIQFKHSSGRIVRRFNISDPVRRIYEWLKAEPIDGKAGVAFELKKSMGGDDMIESLDQTIGEAGLKNGTVMVEYLEE